MATANPTPPDHGEDNFLLELKRVREQIKDKFVELIDCVKARECKLLEELDTILASYHSYRDELKRIKVKKRELEVIENSLKQEMTNSTVKNIQEKFLEEITRELKANIFPSEPKMVYFVCDNDKMIAELNKLGQLAVKIERTVDYTNKVHPVVSVCDKGNGMEQLYYPWGMTVDNKTGKIYVADFLNQCVKVFDSSGKILFKFGDSDGEGKISTPRGLVISGDRILVSNYDSTAKYIHNILVYQLNGCFVSKIGKYGNGKIEFNYPCGLACNESNGDIYICDSCNNRIQILFKLLQFKSQFGGNRLKRPRDVKLSEEYIFILDMSNPCMHLYDYNLILQKSVVSRGEEMQVGHSNCFYVDNSDYIHISDWSSNFVHIFNSQFESIHKINTSTHPMGVVVDIQGRVIVVCRDDRGCLQIF